MNGFWKLLLVVAAASAAGGGLILAFRQGHREVASEAAGEKPVISASSVETGPNGETIVSLGKNQQTLIGLQTTNLAVSVVPREMKAYGEVLDPAPLIALLSDAASRRASLAASSNEYERLTNLFVQGRNASERAVEAAEAAMKRDQIALQAAETQLLSAWGKAIAGQPDLPALVQSLAAHTSALVRVDLPTGEVSDQMPEGGRVMLAGKSEPVGTQFLGRAATTDRQVQGEGFLLLATNSPAALRPGLSVTGFLQLSGGSLRGVIVPDAAVVRSAQRSWIYVQTGDTSFVRREIALDHPAEGGWFVTNNVAPNERVVTLGAQMLLSQERKNEIKPPD